jgi:hypothetical protein
MHKYIKVYPCIRGFIVQRAILLCSLPPSANEYISTGCPLLQPSSYTFLIFNKPVAESPFQVFFLAFDNISLHDENEQREQDNIPPVADKAGYAEIDKKKPDIHGVPGNGIHSTRLKRRCRLYQNNGIPGFKKLSQAGRQKEDCRYEE